MLRRPASASIALALLIAGCAAASPGGPTAAEIGTPSSRLSTPRPDASARPGAPGVPPGPAAYVPGPAADGPASPASGPSPEAGPPGAAPSTASTAPTARPSGLATLPPGPTPSPKPSGQATLPPISPWGTPTPGPSASATPAPGAPTPTPMPSPSTKPNGNAGTAIGAGVVLDQADSLQFNLELQDRGNPGSMTGFAVIDNVGLRITCTPTLVVIAGNQVKASGKARINSMDGTFTVDIQDGATDHLAATFAVAGKTYDLAGTVQRGDVTVTPAP